MAAAAREVAEAPADDAVAEAAPEGKAPPAAEDEAPSATEVEPAAAESADGEVEPPAEGATEGSAEDAAEGAETASGGAAEANMSRLLAADAQRSDDLDLEAPVPVAAASPSPIETAPTMQRVTGTFADPLHESAFAAQLFRMAYPAHVLLLAAILAEYCWLALEQPEERSVFVALVLLCGLPALVGRVLLHRTGSRDPVRSQRLGCWVWAVVLVLACAVDIAAFITAPTLSCAAWTEPTDPCRNSEQLCASERFLDNLN